VRHAARVRRNTLELLPFSWTNVPKRNSETLVVGVWVVESVPVRVSSSNKEGVVSDFVHNEQVKMAATFFNNLGVVSFATGAIAPLGAKLLHPGEPTILTMSGEIISIILGSIGAAVFAGLAQFMLGKNLRG